MPLACGSTRRPRNRVFSPEEGRMSRLLSLFAVIAVAAVAAPGATSADDPLQSSLDALAAWDPGFAALAADPPSAGNQMVVGSLKFRLEAEQAFEHIRISAHSGPAGEDPKGQVHITSTVPGLETDEIGDVVCVDAIGRVSPFIGPTAFVWARLREPHQGFPFVQLQ